MQIPKIIHQIWSDKQYPLPDYLKGLSETWKEHHPEWKYILWDEKDIANFVQKNYPQYWDFYLSLPYDIQRWDAVRYLILYKYGGLYVDIDMEALSPIDELLDWDKCNFALEPVENILSTTPRPCFTNAFMGCAPEEPFFDYIIKSVFSQETYEIQEKRYPLVVNATTGLVRLSHLYRLYEEKETIKLIPEYYISPFSMFEARKIVTGQYTDIQEVLFEKKIEKAYAVHYFLGSWINDESI